MGIREDKYLIAARIMYDAYLPHYGGAWDKLRISDKNEYVAKTQRLWTAIAAGVPFKEDDALSTTEMAVLRAIIGAYNAGIRCKLPDEEPAPLSAPQDTSTEFETPIAFPDKLTSIPLSALLGESPYTAPSMGRIVWVEYGNNMWWPAIVSAVNGMVINAHVFTGSPIEPVRLMIGLQYGTGPGTWRWPPR